MFSTTVVIAQKSMKWMQMQRKRYGEKRRGGYVDMGKQVRTFRQNTRLLKLTVLIGPPSGARPQNHQGSR